MPSLLPPIAKDGRTVIVAIDHALYTYPLPGLEDPGEFIDVCADVGVDAMIVTYGALRTRPRGLGAISAILKLDIARLGVGTEEDSEFRVCWSVDQALRVGADAVLTLVQLGSEWELEQLTAAARVAAEAHEAGMPFVLEALPVAGTSFPDPYSTTAVAAAARMAAELGASVVKTNMPTDPAGASEAASCGIPVVFAGGAFRDDDDELLEHVARTVAAGGAGVAFGRNAWGRDAPRGFLERLLSSVHDAEGCG